MIRERSKSTGGFSTANHEYEKLLDGTILGENVTYTGTLVNKSIRDSITPGFHALQKCGKFLPQNGVEILTVTETRSAANFSVTNHATTVMTGDYYWGYPRTISIPSLDTDKLQNAVNRAASNAASAQWDVLTFLGELKESVETIRGIAGVFNWRTRELALQAARFRRNPWKRFQELWLGYRYGVRPLIYDAKNAIDAISSHEVKFVKGRGFQGEKLDDVATTIIDFYSRWDVRMTEVLKGTRTYRGCAYAKTDALVGSRFGADPLTTAWELIPYSFVVDWFIDIGAYVNTIRPRLLGEYLGMTSSYKEDYVYTQTLTNAGFKGLWTGSVSTCKTEIHVEKYVRSPASVGFPAPKVELSLPHLVDLAALFLQGRKTVHKILADASK